MTHYLSEQLLASVVEVIANTTKSVESFTHSVQTILAVCLLKRQTAETNKKNIFFKNKTLINTEIAEDILAISARPICSFRIKYVLTK